MEAVIVMFVLTGGFFGWVIYAGAKQRTQRNTVLSDLALWLHGKYDPSQGTAWGKVAGADLKFGYVTRGSGSSAEQWTEIDAELPPYPLTIYVRKHGWRDRGKIERGEMVDVIVGDPQFDDACLVEAAPADVAKRLFDAEARGYLLAQTTQFELTTEPGNPRRLRLAVRTWLLELREASSAVEVVAAMARRVRDAYAQVERETAAQEVGSPYRPQLDDRASRDATAARFAEVEQLDAVRAARKSKEQAIGVALIIVCVVVVGALLLR